jgi:hypothetical protein
VPNNLFSSYPLDLHTFPSEEKRNFGLEALKVTKIGLWYPTSREKRARYGAPRICGQDRDLK